MPTVRLVHWNEKEAEDRARILADAGFEVLSEPPTGSKFFQDLETEAPQAIVIDLSRMPSQGRDIAVAIRKRKGTRYIPIVFVGGDPGKVERIKELLPDATYCGWADVSAMVRQVIEAGIEDVVVPDSVFAAYARKPLADKLGIKSGSRVAHVSSPSEFASALGELPSGATLVSGPDESADLTLWFVRSAEKLSADLELIVDTSKRAPVWIAWPKKGAACEGDLTQRVVREAGMNAGMVDYKICSIDRNWSALLFTWRGAVE